MTGLGDDLGPRIGLLVGLLGDVGGEDALPAISLTVAPISWMAVATWTVRSRWAVQLCWVSWALAATSLAVAASWRELLATCSMEPWILATKLLKPVATWASSSRPSTLRRWVRSPSPLPSSRNRRASSLRAAHGARQENAEQPHADGDGQADQHHVQARSVQFGINLGLRHLGHQIPVEQGM